MLFPHLPSFQRSRNNNSKKLDGPRLEGTTEGVQIDVGKTEMLIGKAVTRSHR